MDFVQRSLRRPHAGFTLLELLAVIAIIAVLSGMVIGVGRRASERGKTARARVELAAISTALEDYKRTYGDFPRTDDEVQLLRALQGRRGPASEIPVSGRGLIEAARFMIRDDVLVDPWGRPYVYAYKAPAGGWTNPSFVLYSSGPDQSENSRLTTGGFPDPAAPGNRDNVYAGR